ncbi:hypothetical protein KC19_1G007800 [Ceratodon purpureus]|uniref:BZIP domain-containing protein n=1 Tax=Ceratodon purpureus TaxID=3225 RepID=A0A8T0J0X0_CERPU|nr:hypothetical protein KC19_1G007800 [Ceratodon purpureus]
MCSLKFAVLQVGSVIALVKVTYDLACQIRLRGVDGACRDIVSTDWWNEKALRRLTQNREAARKRRLRKKARRLLKQLLYIGVVVGTVVGALAIAIPWLCPGVFTADAGIISQMRATTLPFLVSMISCPPSLSLEGTLLAGRDFGFLSFSMTVCFIGGTALLLACKVLNWGLAGSWWTLAAFQWARFLLAALRLYSPSSCLADKDSDTTLRAKTA